MAYEKQTWEIKTFHKGDQVFVDHLNHMEEGIAQGGGGGEPEKYLKDALVEGNKLTLTKKDNSQVVFDPVYTCGEGIDIVNNSISLTQDVHNNLAAAAHAVQPEKMTDDYIPAIQAWSLEQHYSKGDTYPSSIIDSLIAGVKTTRFESVEELPSTGETNIIYLVPDTISRIGNDEVQSNLQYIWLDTPGVPSGYKQIGSTKLDISTKADLVYVNEQLATKANAEDLAVKMDIPVAPVAGHGLNLPYYFTIGYEEDKAVVKDYTVDLLAETPEEYKKEFTLDVRSASKHHAGLMSAADKTKLDTVQESASKVTASAIGTSTDEVAYITINGVEHKLAGGTSGEPAAYIKDANVVNDKLSLLKKDGTIVSLDVSGKAKQEDLESETRARKQKDAELEELVATKASQEALESEVTERQNACNELSTNKLDKPIAPPETQGQGLNIPYFFEVKYNNDNIEVKDHTIDLLDKSKAPQVFGLTITSAGSKAGLMSVADKTKLDNIDMESKQDKLIAGENIIINGVTISAIDTIYDDTELRAAIATKMNIPSSIAGQGLNVPYYFAVNYDADKVTVKDYTIDLSDAAQTKKEYSLDINGATQASAGLLTANDKKKVDHSELPEYPEDTTSEYVLGLKYENGAWVKYWKETINRSDVVDKGMVDYMVLKS